MTENDGAVSNHQKVMADDTEMDSSIVVMEDVKPQRHPRVLKFIPFCFRFKNGPPEATGLSLDFFARAVVIMSTIFLGPALLKLSAEAANCPDPRDCDSRIYGMKPSSLVSNMAVVAGLLVGLTMPLFGAVVDYTNKRRAVGSVSAYVLSLVKGLEGILSIHTWLYVTFLQIFTAVLFFSHSTAAYAYNSELSQDVNEQTKYGTSFYMSLYVSTLFFLAEVMILATIFDTDDVGTAVISQIVACVTSGICFLLSWGSGLFSERPASATPPPGSPLLLAGFRKILHTFCTVGTQLPRLPWLMWAIVLSEAATTTLVYVATTFMSHFLVMGSIEIGVSFLVLLLMGIPGSKLGQILALRYNPLTSAKISYIFFATVTALGGLFLDRPERNKWTPLFCSVWGIGYGWIHPMNATMFITMTPQHSTAEYMGFYIFCGQIFSWAPPLLFTILNEVGVSMSIGLTSIDIFVVLGLLCLFGVGDYNKGVEEARRATQIPAYANPSNNTAENGTPQTEDGITLPPVS